MFLESCTFVPILVLEKGNSAKQPNKSFIMYNMEKIYIVSYFLMVKGEVPKNGCAACATKEEADEYYFDKVRELRAKYDVGKVIQNDADPLSRQFTVKHSTVTFNVSLQRLCLPCLAV